MAISYNLDLVTPFTLPEVAQRLDEVARSLRLTDATATVDRLLDEGAVTLDGIWVRVVPRKPIPWGNPLIDGHVFTATASVVFRLDKTAHISGQQDSVVRLATGLLSQVPGDAVLHFDYEDVWLLRQDGELSLSERSDIWPTPRLATVPRPYRRQTHEFAFPEEG
ncbi:SitI3 family protein [Kitasatospora azatica]|uniref:SitI3 family protein n=1 Tax=Kitasatospora azatica TaxID=58347 RepID=UPI00055C9E7A|nr:SitI3 family protein [Kitasatospora azatica]